MKPFNIHNHIPTLLLAALLLSCGKEPAATSDLTVDVERCGTETRVEGSGVSYEDDILSVQLLVYDAEGMLEAEDYFQSTSGSIKVTNGSKTVHALVNSARIEAPATEPAFLKMTSRLEDNTSGRLVMTGSATAQVSGDISVVIRVKRLVSKIQLGEIAADFAGGSPSEIFINSLYLTNVNSSTTFDGTGMAAPDGWFNRMGYSRSACDGILFDSIGCRLAGKASHSVKHTFYAYPNHTADDTHGGGAFSARYTRLVIDTDLGFYHIDFPELSPNKACIINKVIIKGPGGATPEEHVDRASCTFDVIVKDWETGTSTIETI